MDFQIKDLKIPLGQIVLTVNVEKKDGKLHVDVDVEEVEETCSEKQEDRSGITS